MEKASKRKGWETANGATYCCVESNAIKNRLSMTTAEELLWQQLKGNKLGIHFRRQHVIGNYIADFVSIKNRLVIEVDGDYHLHPEQQILDNERTAYLERIGFHVIRFTNNQVMDDMETVMSILIKSLI